MVSQISHNIHMATPAHKLPLTLSISHREKVLGIIEDALSNKQSPVNNPDHPHYHDAVKALRRLQLSLLDPKCPNLSDLDVKRITLPAWQADRIELNKMLYGSSIGKRQKQIREFIGWNAQSGEPVYQTYTQAEWQQRINLDKPCDICNLTFEECDCENE